MDGAQNDADALADHETPVLLKRLLASVVFLLVLMYFSMGHMMFGWPLPPWFDGNHVAMGLVQLLLTVIIMAVSYTHLDVYKRQAQMSHRRVKENR